MLEGRANPLGMVETIKLHWLAQLNTCANGADFGIDCVQLTATHLGDLPMRTENNLQNLPPQTDQNKSYFQLHASPQTTIHSQRNSSCAVHESFFYFARYFLCSLGQQKNAKEI